jgi:hypothetical protein
MQLYIIESGTNCKIGITGDIDQRTTAYSTHNPDFRVAHKLSLPNEAAARRVETAVRRQLSESLVGGREWFAVPSHVMLDAVLQALSPMPPTAAIGLQKVELTDRAYTLREQLAAKGHTDTRELQQSFAQHFSEVFGVGLHGSVVDALDPRPRRIWPGVDHTALIVDQCRVHAGKRSVHFPGQDHAQYFFEMLPLAGGRHVAYCIAVASMPYPDRESGTLTELRRSIDYATGIGWTCSVHPEWTWHHPKTQLVLYQRSQPRAELRRQWEGSLQRWLNEHEKWIESQLIRLDLLPASDFVSDLAGDQHMPLDVTSADDFMDRYWDHFVAGPFSRTDPLIREAITALLSMWTTSKK